MFGFTDDRSGTGSRPLLLAAAGAAVLAGTAWTLASRRQQQKAARLHRILVELLLNALSSGDPVTARHSRRVANLADVLAAAIRMSREEHATLRVAALLHDMGKIEDELFPLVHSASPLSREERDRISHHPCESANILQPLEPFHHGLTRIVSSHHECWNGEGYPSHLRGEQIPLAARIISVADVFDAMTQPRSYHEPRPIHAVLDEIRQAGGERFDPAVVALLDDPAIRERWVEIAETGRREEEREQARAPADHTSP
jgi:putative nucleotidyltransferase with HDIG domain